MGPAHIREYCELDETSKALMRSAMNQLDMSARTFHRVLKLARTIADLAGSERIQAAHLAEAIRVDAPASGRLIVSTHPITLAAVRVVILPPFVSDELLIG